MATNSPYKTYQNIYEAVLKDFKETTSANMVSLVKRWINEGQEQVILRKKRDWLNKTFHYTTEAAVSSTFSVNENGTTVTMTGTAALPFTSAEEHKFVFPGVVNTIFDVASVTSTTITLASAWTEATNTAANGVIFQSSILLDDTIRSVHKVYHERNSQVMLFDKGPEDFRDVVQMDPDRRDFAEFWTLYGYDSVAVSSDVADQRRLQIYPYSHKKYTLHVEANIEVPDLTNDTDESVIPIQHRQVLYWYALQRLAAYHGDADMVQLALSNFGTFLAKMDGQLMPGRDLPSIQRDNLRWRRGGASARFRNFTYKRGSD